MQNREKFVKEESSISSELQVNTNEIISGGPPKDGIPSIDEPKFIEVSEATFLNNNSPGILVQFEEDVRFYPFAILVWHEIVNDVVGGKTLAITYCPLCESSIVFEREINGKIYDFGTSGKLYQSNLVMYDRQTGSLWSQVLGGSILGPLQGTYLQIYPSSFLTFSDVQDLYPEAKVLSTGTGYQRDYSRNPYGTYAISEDIYFPVENSDGRLPAKELIYAFSIEGEFKAYSYKNLIKKKELKDRVAGHNVVITVSDAKEIIVHDQTENKRVYGFTSFWFAWVTHHPDAEVWIE